MMKIREAIKEDWDSIWPIFQDIAREGETYGYDPNTNTEQAKQIWLETPLKTFVLEEQGQILGTYYLKTNHAGPGDHVCNCGYMVSTRARGRGLATSMCKHSQPMAAEFGYKAMQFNFVASSNEGAVRLWRKLGFETVGTIPSGFHHPERGYVDALIMYKWLQTENPITSE
jgi:L-amino acid N-acyltransferase YncA